VRAAAATVHALGREATADALRALDVTREELERARDAGVATTAADGRWRLTQTALGPALLDALEATATLAVAAAGALGALALGAPALASMLSITLPCLILSPTFTAIALTIPAIEVGISIEALSDSTVIKLCSALTASPTLTKISITSTVSKSPMSGTSIAVMLLIMDLFN
jgi:hypothetical protein